MTGVKRWCARPAARWTGPGTQSAYAIAAFTEIKTVWHPKGL